MADADAMCQEMNPLKFQVDKAACLSCQIVAEDLNAGIGERR